MKNPFDLYKMPLGLTDGVDIPLHGTPAVFHVVLPGTMNEEFNMDLMSGLSATPDEEGNIRVDGVKFQKTRKKLFFSNCIKGATGLPDGMDVDTFFATYPLAAKAIYDAATELGTVADEEAQAALEKFKPTPSGKSFGVGGSSNTKPLSKAVSTSKPAARN